MTDFDMSYNAKQTAKMAEIERTCKYHHCSWARGYQSRKRPVQIAEYSGRFGKGYVVHKATTNSNQYHYIEYWILKE